MDTQTPKAVEVARAHIQAWSHQDWETTRALLAPDIHAVVATPLREKAGVEIQGVEQYMAPKMRAAQLIEPGSVREISAVGDARSAAVMVTMRIGLGPGGAMVTMARAVLITLDEQEHIVEERDSYITLRE